VIQANIADKALRQVDRSYLWSAVVADDRPTSGSDR
jgi:hypothetical protein